MWGILIFLVIFSFISLLIGSLGNEEASNVDYGTFLSDIENGKVETTTILDSEIKYTTAENTYVTTRVDDPKLADRLYEADVAFNEIQSGEGHSLMQFLLIWVLPFVLIVGLGQFMIRRFQKNMGGGSNAMGAGPGKLKINSEPVTDKTFDDVAGQDEAKEALQEVVDFLNQPAKYTEIGAKMPKGVLLVGPPGTGKTLLAKAVAGESKVPFFSISGSEFVEMFVGVGAARVRDLFKQAQEKAPSIIFIDELDTIGKSRNSMAYGGNDEREQTLNQLLAEMDGFDADKGVVILAATNRPESLDKALLRAGRFDRRVPVELPDVLGREAILGVHARKVKLDKRVDLQAIAKSTPGASGADLANIINEGALRAVKLRHDRVLQSDLEYAVEIIIAGYERKNAVISEKDKLRIAYHEIGHAIVAAKQHHSAAVHKITIIPRTSGALGFTMQIEDQDQVLLTKEQALSKITTLMGGRAAEEIIFQSITSGASNDSQQATKIARAMVTRFGMSVEFDMMALETVNNPYLGNDTSLLVSEETAAKIDAEILAIIKMCHKNAMTILEENKEKLHELAELLYEKETITGEEFRQLLTQEKHTVISTA